MGWPKETLLLSNVDRCLEKPAGKPIHTIGEELDKALEAKEESKLHDDIIKYLNLNGAWYSHARMDKKTTSRPGDPDFLICWKGHFVGLEAKVSGKNARPKQQEAIESIIRSGGFATVVRSLEEVVAILRRLT